MGLCTLPRLHFHLLLALDMRLPKPLPENVGKWSSLYAWLNALRAAVASSQLVPGEGTQITTTAKGTSVSAKPGAPTRGVGGQATWL